jgi:hypothetical protein
MYGRKALGEDRCRAHQEATHCFQLAEELTAALRVVALRRRSRRIPNSPRVGFSKLLPHNNGSWGLSQSGG